MTYEDIERVNGEINYLPISKSGKTKNYAMVPERVSAFRKLFPEGYITTRIVSHDGGIVLMEACVGYYNEKGENVILGTGFAQEEKGKGLVNGTSYIENCETSAVGRALGFLGLGLEGGGICSAEELANAITAQNQNASATKKDTQASVTTVEKIPKNETPEMNPVQKYLIDSMKLMREARQISAEENNKIFKAQREALVKAKLAPDKRLDTYTMEEATALVDAMYKCFDPTGTELKTK